MWRGLGKNIPCLDMEVDRESVLSCIERTKRSKMGRKCQL